MANYGDFKVRPKYYVVYRQRKRMRSYDLTKPSSQSTYGRSYAADPLPGLSSMDDGNK